MLLTGNSTVEIVGTTVKQGSNITTHASRKLAVKYAVFLSEKNNKQLKFVIK